MQPEVIYWESLQGPWLGDGEGLVTSTLPGPLFSPSVSSHSETPCPQLQSRPGEKAQCSAQCLLHPPLGTPVFPTPPVIGIRTVKSGGGEGSAGALPPALPDLG